MKALTDINLDPTCPSRPVAKIVAFADIYILNNVYLEDLLICKSFSFVELDSSWKEPPYKAQQ